MKIAFVFRKKPEIEPLGVLYLGAMARKHGHDVLYCEFNNPVDRQILEWYAPDYIGYSIMTGEQETFKAINDTLKSELGPFKSIVGGPHPSFFPKSVSWADYTCIGEGENWLASLLDGVYGDPASMNEFPWPDRPYPKSPVKHIITTRGCPYSCTYCYNAKWHSIIGGPKVRIRDVHDVVNEIFDDDSKFIYFQDDCFGIDMAWLRDFRKMFNGVIPYHCHLHPQLVTNDRVRLLAESGCKSVHMAVETADDFTRVHLLNRHMSNEEIRNAMSLLHNFGISVMTQNMIGLPGQPIERDIETLKFNIELNPAYAWCSIYQPYPGTRLANYALLYDYWDGDVSKIGPSFFDTSHLNISETHRQQLEVLQKLFAAYVKAGAVPTPNDLLPGNLLKNVYAAVRRAGDEKLFGKEIVDLWK